MNRKGRDQGVRLALGWLGGLAFSAGVIFLVGEMLDIRLGENFWPLFIVASGVGLFFLTLFLDEEIGMALAMVSGMTTVVGLILFVHAMTGYWSSWPYSWTLLFPTSIGLGLVAHGVGKTRPDLSHTGWSLTLVGLVLFLVFAAFFELILGLGGFALPFGWPLLLFSLGLLLFTLKGIDHQRTAALLSRRMGGRPRIDE